MKKIDLALHAIDIESFEVSFPPLKYNAVTKSQLAKLALNLKENFDKVRNPTYAFTYKKLVNTYLESVRFPKYQSRLLQALSSGQPKTFEFLYEKVYKGKTYIPKDKYTAFRTLVTDTRKTIEASGEKYTFLIRGIGMQQYQLVIIPKNLTIFLKAPRIKGKNSQD